MGFGSVVGAVDRETLSQQEFKAVSTAHPTKLLEPIKSYISTYH
jgi:hypothetical protein